MRTKDPIRKVAIYLSRISGGYSENRLWIDDITITLRLLLLLIIVATWVHY